MSMPVRPVYRLYNWLWTWLDWLYPAYYGGFERKGFHWCPDCQSSAKVITNPRCDFCGRSIPIAEVCAQCKFALPKVSALRPLAIYYGAVRNAIHRLKFKRDIGLGVLMSRPVIDCLIQTDWRIDLLSRVRGCTLKRTWI
jgi:predicted amidophosphoribosyltransferase